MIRINETETAILGLLYNKPMYGYEVEKVIEDRKMRNWASIGFSSIYYILNKLEKKELLHSEFVTTNGKPSRKVYSISDDGKTVLKENITSFISQVTKEHSNFDLVLMNLEVLSKQEVLENLNDYLDSIDQEIKHYTNLEKELDSMDVPFYIVNLASRPL